MAPQLKWKYYGKWTKSGTKRQAAPELTHWWNRKLLDSPKSGADGEDQRTGGGKKREKVDKWY